MDPFFADKRAQLAAHQAGLGRALDKAQSALDLSQCPYERRVLGEVSDRLRRSLDGLEHEGRPRETTSIHPPTRDACARD